MSEEETPKVEDLIKQFFRDAGHDIAFKMAGITGLPALVDQCGKTAEEHGFHDAHAEEARTALRNLKWPNDLDAHRTEQMVIGILAEAEIIGDPFIFMSLINTECAEACEAIRKGNWEGKDGAWEELADVFIRAFDFISRYGPGHGMNAELFLRLIQAKMAKNESRPHLHGKRF